jgi:hypothetical protein
MPYSQEPQGSRPIVAGQSIGASPPRELRAQALHRLQVGLIGLATMLLLVGLANIIMDRARQTEREENASTEYVPQEDAKGASDPLADIGVVPAADSSSSATTSGAK